MAHTGTGRLDLAATRAFREPPSAVDAAADRSACALFDIGWTLVWIGTTLGVGLIVSYFAAPIGEEPSGPLWAIAWLLCVFSVLVGIRLVRLSDRRRQVTGYPIPAELYDIVATVTESSREMREMFDLVEAARHEPQWTAQMLDAWDKQLLRIARRCELAARCRRLRLTWMMPWHKRRAARLAVPLHNATANFAKGILTAQHDQGEPA